MKKCSILAEGLLMTFILAWIPATEGFVNLTVDGGGSLSGVYCPGTVNLFCEGTDLTSIRWSFNGGTVIDSFLPIDSETITFPSAQYPAFVSVELTHVVQNTDPVFGNFSSILTVDLSQLEEQSVSNISCGDPGTTKTVPVNVNIIRRSRPDIPNITGVTATYNSTGVRSVTVAWNKVPVDCPGYGLSLTYIADLNGSETVEVNHTSCEASFCSAVFDILSSENSPGYTVTLSARNDIGSSGLVQYPTTIGSQSEQYITPVLNSSNCITSSQCLITGNLDNGTMCSVQYTTDATYRGLSTAVFARLNTAFQLPLLNSDSTFYFVFTVPITSTFLVEEQVDFTTGSNPQLTTGGTILIVIAGVFVVLSLLLMTVILIVICTGFDDWKKVIPRRHLKLAVLILLVLYMILFVFCVAFLIAVGVVVGIQEDTCDAKWQQTRDGLVIASLLISFLCFVAMIILLVLVGVDTHLRKASYPVHKDQKEATLDQSEGESSELQNNAQATESQSLFGSFVGYIQHWWRGEVTGLAPSSPEANVAETVIATTGPSSGSRVTVTDDKKKHKVSTTTGKPKHLHDLNTVPGEINTDFVMVKYPKELTRIHSTEHRTIEQGANGKDRETVFRKKSRQVSSTVSSKTTQITTESTTTTVSKTSKKEGKSKKSKRENTKLDVIVTSKSTETSTVQKELNSEDIPKNSQEQKREDKASVEALCDGKCVESGSNEKSTAALEEPKTLTQKFVGIFQFSKKEEHTASQEHAPDKSLEVQVTNKPEDTPGTVRDPPAASLGDGTCVESESNDNPPAALENPKTLTQKFAGIFQFSKKEEHTTSQEHAPDKSLEVQVTNKPEDTPGTVQDPPAASLGDGTCVESESNDNPPAALENPKTLTQKFAGIFQFSKKEEHTTSQEHATDKSLEVQVTNKPEDTPGTVQDPPAASLGDGTCVESESNDNPPAALENPKTLTQKFAGIFQFSKKEEHTTSQEHATDKSLEVQVTNKPEDTPGTVQDPPAASLGDGTCVESGSNDNPPAALENPKTLTQKFAGIFQFSKKEEHTTSQEHATDKSLEVQVTNKPEDTPGTVQDPPAASLGDGTCVESGSNDNPPAALESPKTLTQKFAGIFHFSKKEEHTTSQEHAPDKSLEVQVTNKPEDTPGTVQDPPAASVEALGDGTCVESGSNDKSPAALEEPKTLTQKFVGIFQSSKKEERTTSQEHAPDKSLEVQVTNKPEDTPGTVQDPPANGSIVLTAPQAPDDENSEEDKSTGKLDRFVTTTEDTDSVKPVQTKNVLRRVWDYIAPSGTAEELTSQQQPQAATEVHVPGADDLTPPVEDYFDLPRNT